MLLIRTFIGPSAVHGTGLFAADAVAAGTVIWRFTPGFDRAYTSQDLRKLPAEALDFLAVYCYKSRATDMYVFCADHARHMNHSSSPNCEERQDDIGEETVTVARRDIAPGEELFEDYSSFEDADDPDNVLLAISRTLANKDPRL